MLKLKVAKKPDKMHMDLLSDDSDPNSGIWSSITRYNIYKLFSSFLTTNIHVIFCSLCLFVYVHCVLLPYTELVLVMSNAWIVGIGLWDGCNSQ